ncbi:MAG: hypothetical protein Q9165_007711 [Trypethelium subeluteriae]
MGCVADMRLLRCRFEHRAKNIRIRGVEPVDNSTSIQVDNETFHWRRVCRTVALSKTVFIDRGNRNNAMAAFEAAAQHMRSEQQSVYIFPEGTRSYTAKPEMLPFKKGAFHLAVKAQVPIVPIVVANYSNLLHLQSKRFNSGKIPVKGSTKGLSAADVDDLVHRTRDQMVRELVVITELARSQRVALSSKEASVADSITSGAEHRQRAEYRPIQAVPAT